MSTHLTRFDPFPGITRWNETLDQFFQDLANVPQGGEAGLLAPAIDVSEDATRITVTAELPGLEKKDIELSVKDGVLSLRGEKRMEEETRNGKFHRIERRYGSFFRALALPESVEAERIDARFQNGVLVVTLPKRAESRPKSIAIQ
jgi:HSP20 family protein